jgi:cellobiose phosphorylase
MKYGYFDDDKREYVITNPKTPVKWINYVGTLGFGGIVDHTGGALICRGDPALNRITRYNALAPSSEFKGQALYLRFPEGEGYRVFSPTYVPTLDPFDFYECRVGLGYSRILSEFYGLRTDMTIFVPAGESVVVRRTVITNLSDTARELDAIPVAEYTHPRALTQLINADWVPQTMQSQAHREEGGHVVLLQFPFMTKDTCVNVFTSNRQASSFETDRRRFLGANEYGTWAAPLSLQTEELGNFEARRGDNVAALMHHLGTLGPGEAVLLITLLGQFESLDAAMPAIRHYRDSKQVDAAFEDLSAWWARFLATLQVDTPEAPVNSLLNVHNPRQCHTTLNWSRYLSLYQLGFGARGIGFRDSSQDVMGVVANAPEEARALIEKLLQVQKCDGSAMHQFNPLSMVANTGEAGKEDESPDYYGDDHLWGVLAVTAYLKETGDFAFLDRELPYYDKDKDENPVESGTVRDHLHRAIAFTTGDVGRQGLPLLGFADWNDTVNLPAGAESFFVANLYGRALRELIALNEHLGDEASIQEYTALYAAMAERVNACGWDGDWYVRYFDAGGAPIGSHTNEKGQIYSNGQSWPIISGFAPPDRARAALDAVYDRLNTRYGIKLSAPGYDGFDPFVGGITTYPPGAKENGGIFLHANPWVIIAEVMMGNGDRAFEYYAQINPAARNVEIDVYECEPYVYPQNILGDEHPQFGLARNSWLTGTASWAYQAATQYILGIRPTYAGLLIDPCIPSAWAGFKARRQFRGAAYEIQVDNPDRVCRGVSSVTVDGEQIDGNVVPVMPAGAVCEVYVMLEQLSQS